VKDDPRKLKETFYTCCCDLAEEIKAGSRRMDIRERVAAMAMLRQYIASWDEPDESDRGTAVRKYEGLFANKKAAGDPGRAPDAGPAAADNGHGMGDTAGADDTRGGA
jgi:hypothetical protein